MPTLGQMLAATIAAESAVAITPEQKAENARLEKIDKLHTMATQFFEHAKKSFEMNIVAGVPVVELFVQIGAASHGDIPKHFPEMYFEMDWYMHEGRRFNYRGREIPTSMEDPERFAYGWVEFKEWTNANELEAYWVKRGTGGWWELRVRPIN